MITSKHLLTTVTTVFYSWLYVLLTNIAIQVTNLGWIIIGWREIVFNSSTNLVSFLVSSLGSLGLVKH